MKLQMASPSMNEEKCFSQPIFFCTTQISATHGTLEISPHRISIHRSIIDPQHAHVQNILDTYSLHPEPSSIGTNAPEIAPHPWCAPRKAVTFSYHPTMRMFTIVQEGFFVVGVFVLLHETLIDDFSKQHARNRCIRYIPCGPLHLHLSQAISEQASRTLPLDIIPSGERTLAGLDVEVYHPRNQSGKSIRERSRIRNIACAIKDAGSFPPIPTQDEMNPHEASINGTSKSLKRMENRTLERYPNHHHPECFDPFVQRIPNQATFRRPGSQSKSAAKRIHLQACAILAQSCDPDIAGTFQKKRGKGSNNLFSPPVLQVSSNKQFHDGLFDDVSNHSTSESMDLSSFGVSSSVKKIISCNRQLIRELQLLNFRGSN